MYRRVTVHICRVVIGCNASTRPRDRSENVYNTAVVSGCHSFSDIDMANVMLNHSEYCYYNPVVGMQNTRGESDEVTTTTTSHPIERVPSLSGAAADRDIVDVDVNLHTLEQKAVDSNTAFVVGGLVIEKVRTDVSFYVGCPYCKKRMLVDDHGNLRCERHACFNGNTYFLFRVCFVESATGRSAWFTLFDKCMASLLDVGAKDFFLMNESMRMSKLNTLVGSLFSLTIKKSKRNGYTNYNVTHLARLHACLLFHAELQTSDEGSTCVRSTSPVPCSSYPTPHVTTEPFDCATTTSSGCKVNITIDYLGNQMKKTLARHIACGVAELSKLRCYGCEKGHPSQRQHNCVYKCVL